MVLRVLGVPSAAGAYGHGVARAPAALRAAGLLQALRSRGLTVAEAGDLPLIPFTPDRVSPRAQHVEQVVAVARDVADRVATISGAGDVPLVLGGNCTITLGVIAGLCTRYPRLGLAYLDGDADMSTPERTVSGILDAMGIAAMLGLEGAAPAFASLGPRVPLMAGRDIVVIGFDEAELEAESRELLLKHGVHLIDGAAVRGRATAAAADALDVLAHRDGLIVHFDVDVVDSTDLPLAQFPHFNQGLSLAYALEALAVLASAPDVLAVLVTEVNPDNDPLGGQVRRLADGLAAALARSRPAPAFATERLTVRPWHEPMGYANGSADLPEVVAAMLTPAVTASLPDEWHGPFSVERARLWMEQRDAEGDTLLAIDRASGRVVGLLVLHESPAEAGLGVDIRLGYLLAETDWGRGLGRELVTGFVSWCRGQPRIRSVAGGVEADNAASIRILEANGFVRADGRSGGDGTLVYRLDLAT